MGATSTPPSSLIGRQKFKRSMSHGDTMLPKASRPLWTDILLILTIWLILLATMFVLEVLGFDFGFDLWPMREFRNWLAFLQYDIFDAPKQFWAIDNRNALSPWWYNAVRPLIAATPAAPLILHLSAGAFVGLSAYLLIAELTRSRSFGLTVGVLSALFIPTPYIDGVSWNFLGALGCSLLSIWLFAVFCNDRRRSGYLAASYLSWFVAFATYTLQVGAIGAVFFVSLRSRLASARWSQATAGALADIIPYFAFLVLYVMVWLTASSAGIPGAFHMRFDFDALVRSITFGIWNKHYEWFWIWVIKSGPLLMGFVFLILVISFLGLLRTVNYCQRARPTLPSLAFSLLIGVCIAAPTVALETVSDVWTPGTRWPMLYQFWTPLLFSAIVFGAISALTERFWQLCWLIITSCTAALFILLGLGFNHFQVASAREERIFFGQFERIVTEDRMTGIKFPRCYLIKLNDPAYFMPSGLAVASYARTILGQDVSFRVVDTVAKPMEGSTLLIWENQRLVKSPQ